MFPGFSEAQFEFLVTHELANLWHRYLIEPPHVTTNWEEARLGYDVSLRRPGLVYLIQFKLSEHLVGPNSTEYRNGFNLRPYYRIKIANKATSYQYDTLRQTVLQVISRTGNAVAAEYVAPKFLDGARGRGPRSLVHPQSRAWLGDHFKNSTLLQHVLRQKLLGLTGITRDNDHALAICASSGHRAVFSEPEFIDAPYDYGEYVARGFAGSARSQVEAVELRRVLESLLRALEEVDPRPLPFARPVDVEALSDVARLRAVRVLMARHHGAQMFVLGSTPLD